MSDFQLAILQYALCAVLAAVIMVLVLTGHDQAQGTIAMTAGLSLAIGFLFRDATGKVRKSQDNNGNGQNGGQ